MTPTGQKTDVRFANSAIKVSQRFAYEQVLAILQKHDAETVADRPVADASGSSIPEVSPAILDMLLKMRDLAMILHKRRVKRGALELNMPEIELTYDEQGRVSGGHFHKHDISHQIIEEFMLLANEAVAGHLDQAGVSVPAPRPSGTGADQTQGFRRVRPHSRLQNEEGDRSLQPAARPARVRGPTGGSCRSLRPAAKP